MLHKTLAAKATTTTDRGEFTAIAAAYTVDRVKDRIIPGAFEKTIAQWRASGKNIPLHYDHKGDPQYIIGAVDPALLEERPGVGLVVGGQLDLENSELAREAWRLMKANVMGLSFGYLTPRERKASGGINELLEIDLFEITVAPHPVNPDTRFLSLKSDREQRAAAERVEREANDEEIAETEPLVAGVVIEPETPPVPEPKPTLDPETLRREAEQVAARTERAANDKRVVELGAGVPAVIPDDKPPPKPKPVPTKDPDLLRREAEQTAASIERDANDERVATLETGVPAVVPEEKKPEPPPKPAPTKDPETLRRDAERTAAAIERETQDEQVAAIDLAVPAVILVEEPEPPKPKPKPTRDPDELRRDAEHVAAAIERETNDERVAEIEPVVTTAAVVVVEEEEPNGATADGVIAAALGLPDHELETVKAALGFKTKPARTPQELREEAERVAREAEQKALPSVPAQPLTPLQKAVKAIAREPADAHDIAARLDTVTDGTHELYARAVTPDEGHGIRDGHIKAVWSASYINNLPDSAFLHVEAGGTKDPEGKTTPRTLRHFPYKDAEGNIDLPHLRNALARIPQSNLPQTVKDALTRRAQRILDQAKSVDGTGDEHARRVDPLREKAEAVALEYASGGISQHKPPRRKAAARPEPSLTLDELRTQCREQLLAYISEDTP